ncbi:tetratricopeptide repeat protein [Rhodobacteraceae bacterium D3-12]|nr:tetratricopeptide repeat protein [Rhodobacteraceae bacterium D3-12]
MKHYENMDGLVFTASAPESANRFSELSSAYMGFRRDTGSILKNMLAEDPDMPMARCAQGYFAKLFGSSNQSRKAQEISGELNVLLERVNATDREQNHAAALTAWCAGELDQASQLWEEILLDDPNDGMALRLAHFTHFYSGDPRRMRDSMARILPLWSENHRDYGFLLGMYAFGLEECGEYGKAESFGRQAVERNPADAWSVHSVAHVLEMSERHEEGIGWVKGLEEHWSTVNNFRFHLYWHRSLYHLERGEFDTVLALYDEQIVSDIDSDFYLDICNASSLLWRLEMFGVDVGSRWSDLVAVARTHVKDTDLIFVSLHYLMALVAGGDREAAEEMIDNIEKWSQLGDTQAKVCAESGLALAKGLRLARDGKYAAAADHIEPVKYALDRIGGSRAQRDLFHMILLDVTQSSQDMLRARALFSERLGHKVHSDWTWHHYARIQEQLGNPQGAQVDAWFKAGTRAS